MTGLYAGGGAGWRKLPRGGGSGADGAVQEAVLAGGDGLRRFQAQRPSGFFQPLTKSGGSGVPAEHVRMS